MLSVRGLSPNTGSALYPYAIRGAKVTAALIPVLVLYLILHRLNRFKQGQCKSCGYSLRDLTGPVCPECGTNINQATR